MTRRNSLTGLIKKQWLEDGSLKLTFEELLERTIAADQRLQQAGFNPAGRFRQYREQSDSESMLRYIKGFYQYPFAPNFKGREKKLTSDRQAVPTNSFGNSSREQVTEKDVLYKLNRIYGEMEETIQRLDPNSGRPNLATRIIHLTKQRVIPDYIANFMHGIRTLRNRVVHERYLPNKDEILAVEAAWAAIEVWRRHTFPSRND